MSVTSVASNVYSQYQSTIDGLKSGKISPYEAAQVHVDMQAQTRGATGGLAAVNAGDWFVKVEVSAEQMAWVQEVIAKGDSYLHAAGTYAKQTNQQNNSHKASEVDKMLANMGRQPETSTFNIAAYDHLSAYAADHKDEWMAAAKELNISIDGRNHFEHFYKRTPETGSDMQPGVANSQAEKIFRHIASEQEIRAFEQQVLPRMSDANARAVDYVSWIMTDRNNDMKAFAPFIDTLQEAGISLEDLSTAVVNPLRDGTYRVEGNTKNAQKIEELINSNPALRATYDERTDRLTARMRTPEWTRHFKD